MDIYVDCPWCNQEMKFDSSDIDCDEWESECEHCEKPVQIHVQCIPSLSAVTVTEDECPLCHGKFMSNGPNAVSKYGPAVDGCHPEGECKECFIKLMHKDLENYHKENPHELL